MVTLAELQKNKHLAALNQSGLRTFQKNDHLCSSPPIRPENLPEEQPSLQLSTNQACMVEWPDGSHSSVKCT